LNGDAWMLAGERFLSLLGQEAVQKRANDVRIGPTSSQLGGEIATAQRRTQHARTANFVEQRKQRGIAGWLECVS
jgi:hypothetical protein